MKKIIILLLLLPQFIKAQMNVEIGYQVNFLNKEKQFANVSSNSIVATFNIEANNVPIYGGLTYSRIFINDKLLKTNKYNQGLIGIKAGFRPLAKAFVIPVQPFFDASYSISLSIEKDKYQIAKGSIINKMYNYGGGVEVYFTKKHCIAFYYGIENYTFDTKDQLNNAIVKILLKLHFN